MIFFKDRVDAGRKLADLLAKYKGQEVVVFALPRGGVVVAKEIANALKAPLELLFAHKIGHPHQPEYAIAAISESGHVVGDLSSVGDAWAERAKEEQLEEMKRRRKLYLNNRKEASVKGKIAILVDDGIATGLTMQVGLLELKDRHPQKTIAAIPVTPQSTAHVLKTLADEVVAVDIVPDAQFLGAVGAYYERFAQVEDDEVIRQLK